MATKEKRQSCVAYMLQWIVLRGCRQAWLHEGHLYFLSLALLYAIRRKGSGTTVDNSGTEPTSSPSDACTSLFGRPTPDLLEVEERGHLLLVGWWMQLWYLLLQ